jgi:hypothetical protein
MSMRGVPKRQAQWPMYFGWHLSIGTTHEDLVMNKMKTAVFSACVMMAAGGAFAQTGKDASDATKSQGSPGDVKAQVAPGTMQSGQSAGGGSPSGSTMSPSGATGSTGTAGESTRSQGSPGNIPGQMAPGAGATTSPGGAGSVGTGSSSGATGGPGASDATKSQGSPGDMKSQMAPGTSSTGTSPGTGTK